MFPPAKLTDETSTVGLFEVIEPPTTPP